MDVMNVEQVKIVEVVGVIVVMVFEWVFFDICVVGGVVCMVDLMIVEEVMKVVFILVMVKVCIGYYIEVKVFEFLGVDYFDESEVLIFVDEVFYIDKYEFIVLFVCGVKDFGEVFCCIGEGVLMICIKGELGIGNIVEVVCYMCLINS